MVDEKFHEELLHQLQKMKEVLKPSMLPIMKKLSYQICSPKHSNNKTITGSNIPSKIKMIHYKTSCYDAEQSCKSMIPRKEA